MRRRTGTYDDRPEHLSTQRYNPRLPRLPNCRRVSSVARRRSTSGSNTTTYTLVIVTTQNLGLSLKLGHVLEKLHRRTPSGDRGFLSVMPMETVDEARDSNAGKGYEQLFSGGGPNLP